MNNQLQKSLLLMWHMQAIVDKTCQYSNYIVQGIVFMSLQLLTHARKPFSYSFYLHHILVRVALIKFIAYRWLQAMTRSLSPNSLNLAGSVPDMTIQFGLTPSSLRIVSFRQITRDQSLGLLQKK